MAQSFIPILASTVSINVTNTSSALAIGTRGNAVLLSNKGDKWVYVRITAATSTATTADLPLGPNQQVVVPKGPGNDGFAAAITESTDTTTVKITDGWRAS